MLDLNHVLKLSDDVVLRGISNKHWALNVKTGNQYRLNEVSYFILNCFRQETSVAQMLDKVLKEYNVTREILIADCEKILTVAIDNNIVKEVIT